MLFLASHEILLLLLSALKGILLFSGKSSPKAREAVGERRLGTWCSGSARASTCPRVTWLGRRRTMRDTDLRDQEGLARVTNTADELGEGFIIRLFSLLHQQLRTEEASFVPIMHLQTGEWPLDIA
jgi:hypothetical protein